MTLSIVEIGPDDALFDAWYAAYAAALRSGPVGEYAPVWQAEELRAFLRDPSGRYVRRAWAGLDSDSVVATGWLEARMSDNLDLVELEVTCTPDARGRGHARAVLRAVEDAARAMGRTRATALVSWPADDPDGSGSVDLAWARRNGYAVSQVEVQRRLAVPVPSSRLVALEAAVAPYVAPYELHRFVGRVPDELAEGWSALAATLMSEAPTGELELEPAVPEVDRLRANEALLADQGRTRAGVLALTADGEAVAYTELMLTRHEPDRAYQWGTLVRRDHRGHRLGTAVKAANLRQLATAAPDVRTVITFNAEVNTPMVAVNDALGYVAVARGAELVKPL